MSPAGSPAPENGGLIQKILSFFVGMGDPEAEKKKILKAIGKDLSRSSYKFFKPKSHEALPGLARFFYEIYKITAPAQVFLQNANSSAALRSFVIEGFLNPKQKEVIERLSEGAIVEKARSIGLKDIQAAAKDDITTLYAVFDGDLTREIDQTYNTLLSFVNFVNFDYYFLLKKFDSSLQEKSFSGKPSFEAINGDYVTDDLADFLEVLIPLEFEVDWKRLFASLKEYRNAEVIQADAWLKLIGALADLKKSQILEQVVRFARHDPYWNPQPRFPNERIVEPFLQKLKVQTETLLQRINAERRNAKIDEITQQIFGNNVVLRMKNYTEKANVVFAKKMLGGYTQAPAMNFLKAYLMDYFKKDVRELADLVLIRGKWTTNLQSQQLSDAYHAILEISDQILQFDDALADEGEVGSRIKTALMRSDRDKEQMKYLRTMLRDANDKATGIINRAAVNLIQVGRHLKALIEDQARVGHHEIVVNWKEIESASSRPLKDAMVDAYKKIYFMVQLLQFFAKNTEGPQE